MLKKLIVLGSVCLLPACAVTTYDTPGYYPSTQIYVPPPVVYAPPVYIPRPVYVPRPYYHRPHYYRHWR